MSEILFQYEKIAPTTWAYLSSLLMIGLYFKFGRLWSMRNLDLLLLILLAPGLLFQHYGREKQREAVTREALAPLVGAADPRETFYVSTALEDDSLAGSADFSTESINPDLEEGRELERRGYLFLLAATGLVLLRLLVDPTMVRRPLLEPNLSSGGLTFIGCSMFVFLMANVITSQPTEDDMEGARVADMMMSRRAADENDHSFERQGPGLHLLHVLPSLPTVRLSQGRTPQPQVAYAAVAKSVAFLSHLAVVVGIIAIGYWHFGNIKTGIGCATLYLMLPYTALMTGRVTHVLPAALLVWAILCYRRPLTSGVLIGLAIGAVYYPLFLLPLWISFYWQRGLGRFLIGVAVALALAVISLALVSTDWASFGALIQKMFGLWFPRTENLDGIWGLGLQPVYRIPVLAACIALCVGLALWPAQKNLGTLMSCSAAVMTAIQFWHGYGGGLYIAWYLPLLLLTIFRPNLEDRVALAVLGEGWLRSRRPRVAKIRAA